MKKVIVCALLLLWSGSTLALQCDDAAHRIASAFIRRLARDTGNIIADYGVDVPLVQTMALGVPTGSAAARVADKAIRLWWHTESKIRRKCLDAEAAAIYPGPGLTSGEVTDDLFNLYGLPWASSARNFVRPYGARCARVAILQAGYALRDEIRRGVDHWALYGGLVDRYCPSDLFDDIRELSASYLSDLDSLRH